MAIEITARHMQASVGLQDYARKKAGELETTFPQIEHIHVVLDVEKRQHVAEVVVQARHHVRMGVTEATENFRASIDLAMEKIERQLRKQQDKVHEHKGVLRQDDAIRAVAPPESEA